MNRIFTHIVGCILFLIQVIDSSAQTTVYCSATGSSNSYKTGYATSSNRYDNNILVTQSSTISTANVDRGYAVFDLSTVSIPSSATITSVTLTLHFTFPGNNGFSITTYDTTIDLSTVTTASTLYGDINSGNVMFPSQSFGTSSPITLSSNAAAVAFIQAHYNSIISVGFVGALSPVSTPNLYTITGETGTGGSATATAPTLAITYTGCLPTIQISHSGSDTVCNPSVVNFTSSITNGGTSPTYQWKKNGTNITGATTSSYSVTTSTVSTDVYSCVLTSNASCATTSTVNSNNDTITTINSATPAIHITASPGTSICSGTSVTFSSTSSYGGSSPGYQWKKNGTNITGATSSAYTTSTITSGDIFSCVLTSNLSCASPTTATSNSDTITVTASLSPTISISVFPNDTICSGTTVTFTSSVSNAGTGLSYQWKKNGTNIPGATLNVYTSTTLNNGDVIACVVTSSQACVSPAVFSDSVTMTVNPSSNPTITISASPGNTICLGNIVTFSASITNGGTTPHYQWLKNGVPIGGQTNASYTTGAITNSDLFSCVLTSNAPCISTTTITSSPITMTVNPNTSPTVTISANPGTSITSGTNVTFTAFVTNGGPGPTYQWRKNGINIPSATTNPYSINNLVNGDIINVLVTANAPCSSPDTGISNSDTMLVTSGIQQIALSKNEIGIYPNPNTGAFTIQVQGNGILHLISILGQELYQFHIYQGASFINLPANLPKGVYSGRFITDEGNDAGIVRIIYK